MKYKLEKISTVSGNVFEPVKNAGQRVELAKLTQVELYEGLTITSIGVSATAFDMKSGDKINIGGQSLTLDADAAAASTTLSVSSTVLSQEMVLNTTIEMDNKNLFVQYQRKTEGTISGMPVSSDTFGPIEYTAGRYIGDFDSLVGVDLDYIKILPRDFMINEDGGYEALEFKDATNTGLQVGNADQEMIATVSIPSGRSASSVAVWGSVTTKVVEVYTMDVNANGKSSVGSGTTNGVEIDIGGVDPSSTNYLMIIVKVTATSNRIYGGKVTLT
tara:strand:- start:616 stop:1437 length:822 start_codon:yes stop_codon:yes gene_type:complete